MQRVYFSCKYFYNEISGFYERMKRASSKYLEMEKQIQDQKARAVDLVEREYNLTHTKDLINSEIKALTGNTF